MPLQTVDIHTHLLNPQVRFRRFYDKLAIAFFAKSLGTSAGRLLAEPYQGYVDALVGSVAGSRFVRGVCLFPVDGRVDERGREIHRDPTVCSSTEDVLALQAHHPGQVLPFLSVNPRRPEALDLLDEYVERGCVGAKFLQNYWGLDLNDRRFIPYYERLRDLGVPLVIHIGSEYSIQSHAQFERVDMLDLPLQTGVTVIAAHMGLGRIEHYPRLWRNMSKRPEHFDRDYFILLERLECHDNLYADISAILVPLRARALRHLSQQRQIHHKLLFGTDYPVPFSIRLNSYDMPWSERRRIAANPNPFDRYVEAMLHYFPESCPIYTNYQKVLPVID